MKSKLIYILVTVLFLSACSKTHQVFTQQAIWKPSDQNMQQIMKCNNNPAKYQACVADIMKSAKASAEAIAFTSILEGRDFMQSYTVYGTLAFVKTLEIAADHSQGYFLINGYPDIININDVQYIGKDLWPADHQSPNFYKDENGHQIFIFSYPLQDCHACKVKGYESLQFVFDSNGKFLKTISLKVNGKRSK